MPTRWCWPPTSGGCSASLRRLRSRRRQLARTDSSCAPRRLSQCTAVARPACRAVPPGVLGTAATSPSTTSACWSATNTKRRNGPARTGGSVVELHSYALESAPSSAPPAGPAARAISGNRSSASRLRKSCIAATARFSRPATSRTGQAVGTPYPAWCWPATESESTCRWHSWNAPPPPAGRAANQLLRRIGPGGTPAAHGAQPGPVATVAVARRPRKIGSTMSLLHRLSKDSSPFVAKTSVTGDAANIVGQAAPTYREAHPRSSRPRCDDPNAAHRQLVRIRGKPTSGGRPFGSCVAGAEIVAWRDTGPAARRAREVVHTSARIWPPARCDCGTLICRWHGLTLNGTRMRIRLEAVTPPRRRHTGLGATGRGGRREAVGRPVIPSPTGGTERAVTRLEGACEPPTSSPTDSTPGTAHGFTPTPSPGSRFSAPHGTTASRPLPGRGHLPDRQGGRPRDCGVHLPGAPDHRDADRGRRRVAVASSKPTSRQWFRAGRSSAYRGAGGRHRASDQPGFGSLRGGP